MKMDEKRVKAYVSPTSVEVKEENVMGHDYLMAKGRFQGVLKQLTEQSSSESEDFDETPSQNRDRPRNQAKPMRSTYLMKLYDRSVDLAKFEEETPLYPICRAWMANNNKKQRSHVVKRRLSSPDSEVQWNNILISDLYRLPPPKDLLAARIPSPTPEQGNRNGVTINLNYDENPPIAKNELLAAHLERWRGIKRKWIATAAKNEDRYSPSKKILRDVYARAHEAMLEQ